MGRGRYSICLRLQFYFDTEAVPKRSYLGEPRASFEPTKCKVITVQYQALNFTTGKPIGPLTILKEWELGSEEALILETAKFLLPTRAFDRVLVGNNLHFDFRLLKYKFGQYLGLDGLDLEEKPYLDIKHVLIMKNRGFFKGYSKCIGKQGIAHNISDWYYSNNYNAIMDYIRVEAGDFLRGYQVLMDKVPSISW